MDGKKPCGALSSAKDKEIFISKLNLGPQPIVQLRRLNIPKPLKNGKETIFSINVNSKEFKELTFNFNNHKIKYNIKNPKEVKHEIKARGKRTPRRRKKKIDSQSEYFNNDESFISNNELTHSTDGQWIQENRYEKSDEADVNDSTESITRMDKTIDTFLNALRKITDDNSILIALQRDYVCDYCKKRFLNKQCLRKHMILCMGLKKPTRKIKEGNHFCPVCKIKYMKKESLDKHNANIHNLKKLYKCLVCCQHFYNEEALTLHCRSRHGLGGMDIYKCPYCENSFNLRGELYYHCRKAHNKAQYFVCSMCLECFKTKDSCKLHEKSHGYCCEICMFRTKCEHELNTHKLTHLYRVVHKCERCSRTFKARRDFTKHINVHEREKKIF